MPTITQTFVVQCDTIIEYEIIKTKLNNWVSEFSTNQSITNVSSHLENMADKNIIIEMITENAEI